MDMWTAVLAAGVVGLLLGCVLGAVGARRVARGSSAEPDDDHQLALALAPLSSTLARVERQVGALERDRIDQFARLDAQLTAVQSSGEALRAQTAALAGALRSPNARGAWGEVQLRRVVEHAGMLNRVDFSLQATGTNAEGRQVRPDALVHLPGGKHVVVDAKAPLAAFLDASQDILDGEDAAYAAERQWNARRQHAVALRQHVDALAAKEYWTAFEPAPELVVCFVPGESFLAAACEADPSLLEHAMARKVVLATPTTLLTMLRTVALTWQQDALAGNARELFDVGRELYRRLGGLGGHVERLGRALHRAVEDYNGMVGSLERRVLVTARRMHDLEVTDDLLPGLDPVETTPRPLTAAELIDRAS